MALELEELEVLQREGGSRDKWEDKKKESTVQFPPLGESA